jgi:ethanolamine utilization cobalamin adenosyltransferase
MRIPAGAGVQVPKAAVLTPLAIEFIESRKIALIRV